MPARILLAWEDGAGRGHITSLKSVAQALGEAFIYDASLCRMEYAAELEPICELVFPGGCLQYDVKEGSPRKSTPWATWGEVLGDIGFRNKEFLVAEVAWWQENIRRRGSQLVIADYAPCAVMAAHSMGIPVVVTGTGYAIPPIGLDAFPLILPDNKRILYDEAEMVANINDWLTPLGVPELKRLSDIYRRDEDLVRTLEMFDPYQGQRSTQLLVPVADISSIFAKDGDEIFIYVSVLQARDELLISALAHLPVPRRIFAAGMREDLVTELAAGGVIIETAPVPVDLIAKRSRLIVHLGQHGIMSLCIAAGLPQVALPQHLEQTFHARRAEAKGVAKTIPSNMRDVGELCAFIMAAYNDDDMARTARAVAEELRPEFARDPVPIIRERVLPLLG